MMGFVDNLYLYPCIMLDPIFGTFSWVPGQLMPSIDTSACDLWQGSWHMTYHSTHPSQCAGLHRRCCSWCPGGVQLATVMHRTQETSWLTSAWPLRTTLPAAMHSRLCVAKLTPGNTTLALLLLLMMMLNVEFQILVRDSAGFWELECSSYILSIIGRVNTKCMTAWPIDLLQLKYFLENE